MRASRKGSPRARIESWRLQSRTAGHSRRGFVTSNKTRTGFQVGGWETDQCGHSE